MSKMFHKEKIGNVMGMKKIKLKLSKLLNFNITNLKWKI